jgi:molybdopterin-guanine dinucleotide biosynthesis protein A
MASIVSINVSPGGIPKRPVDAAMVTDAGLAGDGHDHAKHDSPLFAVSLIDVEDLDDLEAEGFDVFPGATGENVTVRGLQVDDLEIGDRLNFSGGVELELTKKRKPCYVLDAIDPRLKEVIVGRCGFLAKVLAPGPLQTGETIEIRRAAASDADEPASPCLGVILAGGSSRRMGRPKHAIVLEDGRTMIEKVADAMRPVCTDLVVAGPAEALRGVESVADARPGSGPLAGIEAVLTAYAAEQYLVCPCDLPRLSPAMLERLLRPTTTIATVFCVEDEDLPRPLPARLDARALPVVSAMLDEHEHAMWRLLSRVDVTRVLLARAERQALVNANTPGDVAGL